MKTLSVKQPWALLLVAGIKDIENRTWKTSYRGRIFIHASGKAANFWDSPQWKLVHDEINKISINKYEKTTGLFSSILGSVEIVDCVLNHESVWAEHFTMKEKKVAGEKFIVEVPVYNWVIANPIMFANPQPNIKGKLGLWDFDNTKGILDLTQVKL